MGPSEFDTPVPGAAEARRLAVAVGLTWLVAVVAFAYAAHPFLPYNSIRLPFDTVLRTYRVAPQGWKFFTRDPQEARIFRFVRGADRSWRSPRIVQNASAANAFDIDRSGAAQGHEVAAMLQQIGIRDWAPCTGTPADCFDSLAPVAVKNDAASPSLCGEVAFAAQKPTPWAWVHSGASVSMPATVIRLDVKCSSP